MWRQQSSIMRRRGLIVAAVLASSTPFELASQSATIVDLHSTFSLSGAMGDGEYDRKYVRVSAAERENAYSPPTSIKISYAFGPRRWAGLYFLNEPDNWGDRPGNNYAGKSISKVSFWARGQTGEEIVEFKAGGIVNPTKKYRDSFAVSIGRLSLTTTWTRYEISLSGVNLSSVIGGFCWVVSADYNVGPGVVFYIDDVRFQ